MSTILSLEGVGAVFSFILALYVFIYTQKNNKNAELVSMINNNTEAYAEINNKVTIIEQRLDAIRDNSQSEQLKEVIDNLTKSHTLLSKELYQINTSIAVIRKTVEVLEKHNEEVSCKYNKMIDTLISNKIVKLDGQGIH